MLTYVFVKVVNVCLHRAAAADLALDLLLRFLELLHQRVVELLRLLRAEEALGAQEVLDHAVQVALTTSDLRGIGGLLEMCNSRLLFFFKSYLPSFSEGNSGVTKIQGFKIWIEISTLFLIIREIRRELIMVRAIIDPEYLDFVSRTKVRHSKTLSFYTIILWTITKFDNNK